MEFIWEDVDETLSKKNIQEIKERFEAIDNYIYQNIDKTKFKLIKTKKRKIKTHYGVVIFNRRIYKDLTTGKNICFTDLKIGISYRSRLIDGLKHKILNWLDNGKRYKDIIDTIPEANVSHSTISRLFKNAEIKQLESTAQVQLSSQQRLYINTDDCYMDLLDNGKKENYRIRLVTWNSGIDKEKSKYRNVLATKFAMAIVTKHPETIKTDEFANLVSEKTDKFFNHGQVLEKTIGGDGAPWIRTLANKVGAEFVLDKYHAVKYFKSLWMVKGRKDKVKFNLAIQYFDSGNWNELMLLLDKDSDIYNYFKNNKQGVINTGKEWNIGVSAESDVSHLVKSIKGYGAKIYTVQTFTNMMHARINTLNFKNSSLLNFWPYFFKG